MNNPRIILGLLLAATTGWLVYLLTPILTPFLVAALLAYLGNPLVTRLTRLRLPRALAVVLVFLLFALLVAALLVFILPAFQRQIVEFAQRLPTYFDWLQRQALPWIEELTGAELVLDVTTLRETLQAHWREMGGWLRLSVEYAMQSGLRLVGWLVTLVLIPVVTFYLLLDWDRLLAKLLVLLPASKQPRARGARPRNRRGAGELPARTALGDAGVGDGIRHRPVDRRPRPGVAHRSARRPAEFRAVSRSYHRRHRRRHRRLHTVP